MTTVLYILLGIVIGVVAVPLLLFFTFKAFLWWLKRKIKSAFGDAAGLPPFRLEVVSNEKPSWHDQKRIEQLTTELEQRGFQQAGDYTLAMLPPITVRGFANSSERLYAIIYDWPPQLVGIIVDIAAFSVGDEQDEAEEFTVSNAPVTGLNEPPYAHKTNVQVDLGSASETIQQLCDEMKKQVAGRELHPTSTNRFTATIKRTHAREMDWQVERGGPQREEIIRNLVTMQGVSEDDESVEPVVEETRQQWRTAIAYFMDEKIQERFLRHVTKMSASEWEDVRDRLYVVHEQSLAELVQAQLADRIVDETDNNDDEEEDEDEDNAYERLLEQANERLKPFFDGATPRDAFQAAQEILPEGQRYKRLARITGPWPADVYLEPEES